MQNINQKIVGCSQLHPLVPAAARVALTFKRSGRSLEILRTINVTAYSNMLRLATDGDTFSNAAPSSARFRRLLVSNPETS
jgi:hypothetical protein